jgi:site-specific DNA-methyltransferase (adenine-specific)
MSQGYMPPSETVEWSTPQDLWDTLDTEFVFTIDVAATEQNRKTTRYYDEAADGLAQSWEDEVVWCNPPYGRAIKDWVKKASEQKKGVVVMLIPSRTETKWFHEYIYNKAEIRFIKGRLKFGGHKSAAPFPNMIVVWRNP